MDADIARELLRALEPMAIDAALQAERRHMESKAHTNVQKGPQLLAAMASRNSTQLRFTVAEQELAFYNSSIQLVTEAGEFQAWIAPDSAGGTPVSFRLQGGVASQ